MPIPSMRVVYHRTLLGVLVDRGIRLHLAAEWCRIPITEFRRLLEFGSPLDAEAAERLAAWGTRMIEISKPKTAGGGDERVQPGSDQLAAWQQSSS